MEQDMIKRQTMGGRVIVTGIRLDGVTKKISEWIALPEVTISHAGLRKRIKAGEMSPREMVFAPSRGNVHTKYPGKKPKFSRLDAVIREYYPGNPETGNPGGSAVCMPHLPGVTAKQIVRRAHDIGVKIADMKKFCETRPQNKGQFLDTDLKVQLRRVWVPLDAAGTSGGGKAEAG